ncbi:hypothetical protein EJ02DRAFT_458347 [Clathrospora elynae]|uniref:Hydrophobin n=1 Tax=Clathrospora elynae TaxID=706981 RepID=A0A6A5SE96_9PLEO|nr:hypothetical protein EJ02DRAFT_458347 [Clathrospora elynae]
MHFTLVLMGLLSAASAAATLKRDSEMSIFPRNMICGPGQTPYCCGYKSGPDSLPDECEKGINEERIFLRRCSNRVDKRYCCEYPILPAVADNGGIPLELVLAADCQQF